MPIFKTTQNIFDDFKEYFDENWMDRDTLFIPERKKWDYKTELTFEDVDIWEVIYESSGGIGVYAAYSPYSEFYLVRPGLSQEIKFGFETYYGKNAEKKTIERMKELGIPYSLRDRWVDEDEMWMHV
jgi:hypothetical protein